VELSVSYNGDLKLIDALGQYSSVVNIYGAASKDITGGGRGTNGLSVITKQDIEKAVVKAHENKIEFNYLLNSSCMGNKEFLAKKRDEIIEHLSWLESINVDWVTIANPYLIEICKNKFPGIKVSLSSFAMVESVERAKFYDSLGVDEITVRENINRDLNLLREIQKNVKCKIQVLVNQTCLHHCPYQFYHDNVMSHASQKSDLEEDVFIDYCILKCIYRKFDNPTEIIKSNWIRPEDLCVYEDYGIDKFKITDRGKSSNWIVKVVKSYHERKYDGNLADILNIVQVHNKRTSGKVFEANSDNEAAKKHIKRLLRAYMILNVQMDNSKLDGFIEFFKNGNCRHKSCDSCGYCSSIAQKVISFPNSKAISHALDEIKEVNKILINEGVINMQN